jgi:hypothetical protein
VSAPGDYDNGEIGGMIGRGNRSTRRKPAPLPLCPPQTPHAARTRTRAAAVGSQRLTAELRHGPYVSCRCGIYKIWRALHMFCAAVKMVPERTTSLQQSPPGEPDSGLAIQKLTRLSWNPKGSLPWSQESDTGLYPEPDESSALPP